MTHAIVINGSPRKEKGDTATLLAPFIQGMEDAGAQVELLYASRLKVKPCTCGNMYCWYFKPGECCIQDDMQSVYAKLKAADTLVLATPVYIPLPGAMQNVINRLCPLMEPFLEFRDSRTRARLRGNVGLRRLALVAVGAWWEIENLATVVRIAEEFAADAGVAFAGAVLRPHAFLMRRQGELTADGKVVLEAARRAGRELVADSAISKATLDAISRPLITEPELRAAYNGLLGKSAAE